MKKVYALLFSFITILSSLPAFAGPGSTTTYIKVDQFGYRCSSKKIAVLTDPQVGYNAAESFNPSTGTNQYEVRRWDNDQAVFTGTITIWNTGQTHTQSGDKCWWFDFSTLQTPGSYYIYDKGNAVGSYRFDIGDGVYDEVLKAAVRSYYYQRSNFAKTAAYAGANWADGASHTKDAATLDLSGNNPKDLSGGWYDAGDYNKYTTFTAGVIPILLEAYRENGVVFKDNTNIPESGNGVPDVLDEVKWELDWLKKMQDATGNGGLFLKVGEIDYTSYSPPSTDPKQRYYYGECTSATLTGALDFAIAALVYKNISLYTSYGTDMQTRAEQAWARATVTTSNFTTYQTACDNGTIHAGDADVAQGGTDTDQLELAVSAAVYLYELTGKAVYKTFVEANYTLIRPYREGYWHPYRNYTCKALLNYTTLTGISITVKTNIINNLKTETADGDFSLGAWTAKKDPYMAPMADYAYRWGSNCIKGGNGMMNLDKAKYLNDVNKQTYRDIAEGMIHYIHGVNPQTKVYLSNMDALGSENSVNEFYHTWYADGTAWDNAKTSSKGPAPGYLVGGPNYWYVAESGGFSDITPPAGQPHQKAYKDWNTGWDGTRNVASYAITENGIYYQANYINALARIMDNQVCGVQTCKSPSLGPDQSTCTVSGSITLNSNLTAATNRTFTWGRGTTTLVAASLTATNYVITAPITAGQYWVKVDSMGCSNTATINITTSLPAVNLGANISICSPATNTLNAGITATGMTYAWSFAANKTFVSLGTLSNETSQTLSNVRSTGLYRVIATLGTCQSWDTLTVTSVLPTPVDGCAAGAGVQNLSVVGAGSYEWYANPTGGTALSTGSTYAPNVMATTTYYVQDNALNATANYSVGPTNNTIGAIWSSNFTDGNTARMRFTTSKAVTLKTVNIYPESGTTSVTIRLLNSTFEVITTQTITGLTTGVKTATLNFSIPNAGTYYLDYTGGYLSMNGAGAVYPYSVAGVISLDGTDPAWWATSARLPYFYNWQISSGGNPCERMPVIAKVGTCSIPVKTDQTITFGAIAAKVYGDPSFTLTATASSGLAVTYTSSNPAVATVTSAGVVTIVSAGSTIITASQAGNANYTAATAVTQTLVVGKASQTITFGAIASKAVGDPNFTLTASVPSGLAVTYTSSNPAVAAVTSAGVVTIVGAGSTIITASQAGNANYTAATAVTQTFVVTTPTKTNQTITFGAIASKVVGDPNFTLSATASSGLAVTYTSSNPAVATVTSTGVVTIVGAGSTVITASQDGNVTYNAAPSVTQTLTVTKKIQTVTFDPITGTKVYGDPAFPLTSSSTSGLPITYATSDPSVATVSSSGVVTIVGAGTVTITATQAGDGTYASTSVPQTITIGKANQTITFGALASKAVGDANFSLAATASSGLAVTYTSSNTAVATVTSAGVVTIVGAGSTVITASQAGNATYNAAPSVTQTLVVTNPTTAIHLGTASIQLNLYPNPATNILTIALIGGDCNEETSGAIWSASGSYLGNISFIKDNTDLQAKLDVADFASGLYFIIIECNGSQKTVKFNKE